MQQPMERVIHSYDPARRAVRCGIAEQSSSTKHAAQVTCATCRELMRRAAAPAPAEDAAAGA